MHIPSRFNGPPDSAHGGVACGMFAAAVDSRRAAVRLLKPPPLEVNFTVQRDDDRATVVGPDGPTAVVRSLPDEFVIEPFPWLEPADVQAAEQDWIERVQPRHVFPTCFGCGHERPDRDGLALFAGEVLDGGCCVAAWTPDASLADATGAIPDWVVWAALDCPSGAPVLGTVADDTVIVLGEMAVHVSQSPRVGETYEVVGRNGGRDGRRLYGEVGLVNAHGDQLAFGRSTWIVIPPS